MGHFGDNSISIEVKELVGKTGKAGLDKKKLELPADVVGLSTESSARTRNIRYMLVQDDTGIGQGKLRTPRLARTSARGTWGTKEVFV